LQYTNQLEADFLT